MLLALGFVQVILGVLIVTFSLVTASITTNTKIKHSCPSWAGFSLAVSGLIGCISWKKPITLVVTAFTLVSALSVMLSLAGSILSCQNGQLVRSFNSCKKENNWCICCHPVGQQESLPDCRELEKLTLYPNHQCDSIRIALKVSDPSRELLEEVLEKIKFLVLTLCRLHVTLDSREMITS